MIMKINLISFTALPHHSAESIHIAMTAKSLNEVNDFQLWSPFKPWRLSTLSKNISSYGLEKNSFDIKKTIQFKPNGTLMLNFIRKSKDEIYYCRQGLVAKFFLNKGLKVVWEQHALPSVNDLVFLKKAMTNSDFLALIVITETLKTDILQEIGHEYEDRIYVFPDAAAVDRFTFDKEVNRAEKILGYVGSSFPGKGFEIIDKLMEYPSNKIEIYGVEKDNKKNVKYNGRVPYSQIPNALKSFDIGLLPNQLSVKMPVGTDIGKYTSPMKMFEYMAAGKVIIASDIPVIKEVLKHNYNAILVPHDDPKAWQSAIEELKKDSDLYNRLRRQAYLDVCNKYSYNARAHNIVQLIEKSLE